jgi:hypothetical protein
MRGCEKPRHPAHPGQRKGTNALLLNVDRPQPTENLAVPLRPVACNRVVPSRPLEDVNCASSKQPPIVPRTCARWRQGPAGDRALARLEMIHSRIDLG